MKRKFQAKTVKSSTKILLVCCVNKECKCQLHATKLGNSDLFEIRIYNSTQTCNLDMISHDHCHTSSGLISESIREIYKGLGRQYRPKDIIADIRSKYDKGISYDKAWRVSEIALSFLRGAPEESYSVLPSYFYVLEQKNLGIITDIIIDHNNQLKFFFSWLLVHVFFVRQ